MYIHYWTVFRTEYDTSLINKINIFNTDSIRKEFTSEYIELKGVEVYKDYSDSTIHGKIELDFYSFDSLNLTDAFIGTSFSIKDGPEENKIFSQFITPFASGFGFDADAFVMKYTYYLPGKITKHNAHEKSNNKLVWEYTLSEIGSGKTINATYVPFRLKGTPTWIYLLALFVIIVVIIFLFKKK
jgi:hypothetical protein